MPEIIALTIALIGGLLIGLGIKAHRVRAEGFLAGRAFERQVLRQLIDDLKGREDPDPRQSARDSATSARAKTYRR